tara:strand:+ start:651 stop:800 length:150 start_codon:yes stop_codon:yes gene_type:complete
VDHTEHYLKVEVVDMVGIMEQQHQVQPILGEAVEAHIMLQLWGQVDQVI